MKKKIYASYGVLGHEKCPLYTADRPAGDIYDEITVEIPFPVWETQSFSTGITIEERSYLLNEVLTNVGDDPALLWYNDKRQKQLVRLEVVE